MSLLLLLLFSYSDFKSEIRDLKQQQEFEQLMGCGASKADDLPLVSFCRERKDLIKSAADHRFALAAAHIAYFRQLRDVGDSLCRFVEEELILSATTSSSSPSSPSSLSSPVLTLPSDEPKYQSKKRFEDMMKNTKGKKKKKKKKKGSSSTSISHNLREMEMEDDNSHLHLSSDDDSEMGSYSNHHSHSGHLDIDEEEDGDEDDRHHHHQKSAKVKTEGRVPSPQPGISYIPESEFSTSNYPFPYDSYANPYYPQPSVNSYSNGVPPYYYANPNFNTYYPDNGFSYYNNGSNSYGSTTSYTTYYMKKSPTRIPSQFYVEPKQNTVHSYLNFPGQSNYASSPNFGFTMNSDNRGNNGQQLQQQKLRPPTPPSPKVSAWDYFNPFETLEGGGYSGYYGPNTYGYGPYGSNTSSPDSREVREREGIPELEEETESEVIKEQVREESSFPKRKNRKVQFEDMMGKNKFNNSDFDEGTSKGTRRSVPSEYSHTEELQPEPVVEVETVEVRDEKERSSISSPETEASISESLEDVYVKKKGGSFDMDGSGNGGGGRASSHGIESSKPSSTTTLSAHGTRDLREVAREIKDEFEAATDYGKEVSVLLEVEKAPYKSRSTFLKVILATVCSTSLSSSYTPSSSTGGYHGNFEDNFDSRSLALTLDKLYAWEKKLYKEVKDEERLRVLYEKQCKKLKTLDDQGAESGKIEATQASIRKLLTKINVSVKAVDSISSRIHKLRDEELQPQMKELIYGLRKMWKLMLKCHQKQFQAILESKTRALKANIGLRRDSSVRATIQLEAELLKWCQRFNNWIEMQRSYADTLNGWLEKCIQYEPEVTVDGVVPFSPARIGAPPVFVICHDWKQAMERVSASEVQTAMNDFATSLHQLWERQDEEQRRRVKAENMYKDFEKQIRGIRMDKQRKGHEHDDSLSDKNSLSLVASESGISPLDDLKVDLDSMRQRVREERAGHKEAVKLVHDAVSRTIQAGLIPIFESLESFTSEASKAFDDVRLEHGSKNS